MRYMVWVIAGLYAALSVVASVAKKKQWKTAPSLVAMFCGGLGLLTALVLDGSGQSNAWVLALAALVCIAAAAWKNSALVGSRHLPHHVVRWCLSLLILLGLIAY